MAAIASSLEGDLNRERATRRRSRRKKPRLTEEAKVKLLSRETEAAGPAQLAMRYMAVNQARLKGDAKLLMGELDDLAAIAVQWRERVDADMHRKSWR